MCFWEIVGSRNAVSFNTKCVSIFGRISSANGRVQDEIHAQSMWDHRSLTVFCIPRTLDILCVAAITPDGRIRIVFCNARLFSASWCGVLFRDTCYAAMLLTHFFFFEGNLTHEMCFWEVAGALVVGGWWASMLCTFASTQTGPGWAANRHRSACAHSIGKVFPARPGTRY